MAKKLMHLEPTDEVITKLVGPPDSRREEQFQLCDLFMPGKRNPIDYEYNIEGKSRLSTGVKYYLDNGSGFTINQYGSLEMNRYRVAWMDENELIESLQ